MKVDLAEDPYADPKGEDGYLANQYIWVAAVEPETPDCTLVRFENHYAVGFPPDHIVKVYGLSIEREDR